MFAVLSALIGGVGGFTNKIAAQKKYDSLLVMFFTSVVSLILFTPIAMVREGVSMLSWQVIGIAFLGGVIFSFSNRMKITVLHHIDSAIFLPLFKVVGPLMVIFFGMIFFGESFSVLEWVGLLVSLFVPLLLISRSENTRQSNLKMGLILVVVCAATSAISAALQKFATDIASIPTWIMVFGTLGVFVSATVQYLLAHHDTLTKTIEGSFSKGLLYVSVMRSTLAGGGAYLTILAYSYGGPLGIVYTINSLWILPAIVLAIVFYGEHWNFRKALAIFLSIVALALLR